MIMHQSARQLLADREIRARGAGRRGTCAGVGIWATDFAERLVSKVIVSSMVQKSPRANPGLILICCVIW